MPLLVVHLYRELPYFSGWVDSIRDWVQSVTAGRCWRLETIRAQGQLRKSRYTWTRKCQRAPTYFGKVLCVHIGQLWAGYVLCDADTDAAVSSSLHQALIYLLSLQQSTGSQSLFTRWFQSPQRRPRSGGVWHCQWFTSVPEQHKQPKHAASGSLGFSVQSGFFTKSIPIPN